MTLIDFILNQKIILISIGFALTPLLAAITLAMVTRIRRRLADQKRIQVEPTGQTQPVPTIDPNNADSQVQTTPTNPKQAEQAPAKPAFSLQQQSPEEQPTEPDDQEQPVSSAMQAILSDVFGDDELSARQETLLKGLETVGIFQLVGLCQEVADQLQP
jgi:hypothetical protein